MVLPQPQPVTKKEKKKTVFKHQCITLQEIKSSYLFSINYLIFFVLFLKYINYDFLFFYFKRLDMIYFTVLNNGEQN